MKTIAFGAVFLAWSTALATAAEIKVMISGGLTAAYRELVPKFEEATGNKVSFRLSSVPLCLCVRFSSFR